MVRDDGADGDAARLLVARGAPVYKPSQAAVLGLRERLAQLLDECPDDSLARCPRVLARWRRRPTRRSRVGLWHLATACDQQFQAAGSSWLISPALIVV